jgi:hypothetical protein
MASAASPPAIPPTTRPASLGGFAFRLAVGVWVGGPVALIVDLIVELIVTGGSDPADTRSWPVNPFVIAILMGVGWFGALVIAVRAIVTWQRRDRAVAAIGVALLPEIVLISLMVMVIEANWPWR